MDSQALKKCSYPPCHCVVDAGERFCGAACANAVSTGRGPCLCGHVGCVEAGTYVRKEKPPAAD